MTGDVIIGLSMGGEALLVLALLDLSERLTQWAVAFAAIMLLGMIGGVVLAPP